MTSRKITPIFVGGCPRSGTTLLGSIIGAHHEVICTPESQFKNTLFAYNQIEKLSEMDKIKLIKEILDDWRFKLWDMDINIESFDTKTINSCKNILDKLVLDYAGTYDNKNIKYWADHTPGNIRYINNLKLLYPDARFIHIVRDGRAVSSSVMKLDWGPNYIKESAYFWLKNLSFGLAAENSKFKHDVLRVYYEDLVREPFREIKKICEFTGMDYSESMISQEGFRLPSYTSSQHKLIGHKPDIKSTFKWKSELKEKDIELFEFITGDLLEYLGYKKLIQHPTKKTTIKQKIENGVLEVLKKRLINTYKSHKRRNRSLGK